MKLEKIKIPVLFTILGFFLNHLLSSVLYNPCFQNGMIKLSPNSKFVRIFASDQIVAEYSRIAENASFVSVFQSGEEIVSVSVPTDKNEGASILVFSEDGQGPIGELILRDSECLFENLKK